MNFKRSLLVLFSIILFIPQAPMMILAETTKETVDETANPEPLYHWGFEPDQVDGKFVANEVNEEDDSQVAELNLNATVTEDAERGNVLHLPGEGWLTLPSGIYDEVSDELTVTMWANISGDAGAYSRLFSSTITEKHQYFQGVSGAWADPEFSIVAGGGEYNQPINTGTDPEGAADYRAAIHWEEQPLRDEWQHITFTMKSDGSYHVYLDGIEVDDDGIDSAASIEGANVEEAVQNFFNPEYLEALIYNDFGRSIYTSDNDVIGYFDDIKIYNKVIKQEEVNDLMGADYIASLKSVTIGEDIIEVNSRNIRYETNKTGLNIEDITVEKTNPESTVEISERDAYNYEITVTSANGLKQNTYVLQFYNPELGAIANFNMTETNGEIMHGASGFLYGVSEPNVPTVDLLSPLKPQSVEQKPPFGLQHPTGDGLRVADTYFEAGTEWIQLAVPDMYLEWPYEYEGLDHYEELVRETVRTVKETRHDGKIVYVIFNEPNGIWFSGNLDEDGFLSAWERMYNVVKEEDPDALIAGPNLSHYDSDFHEEFVEFAVENDVLPDQFTWHELSGNSSLSNWDTHMEHYKNLEEEYGFELPVVINEYVNPEDSGVPGNLIRWLSRVENSKVYASLAYWHSANTLNELAVDMNKPNGAWWMYKWYGDMTGETIKVNTANTTVDGLYGLASIDDQKGKAYTIFGGEEGNITTTLENLADTETFKNAEAAHVKLYRTKFTGFMGSYETPRVEFEGNLPIVDGNLNITISDADELNGYHAIVTPATDDSISDIPGYQKTWEKTYEAEDAELNGVQVADQGWVTNSNGKYVRGLNSSDKIVKFTVDAPQDGKYKLEVYYGNQAPLIDGKNRAVGELAKQSLKLDGEEFDVLTYDSTMDMNMFASEKLYVDLTAGTHSLEFSKHSGLDASLDKIDLTYVGEINQDVTKTYRFEAEESNYDNGLKLSQSKENFSGAGYIEGNGNNEFSVVVEDNGYYDLELGYASDTAQTVSVEKRIVNYPSDATINSELTTEWRSIANYSVEQSNDITSVSGEKVYLTAGANTLKVTSENEVSLDYLTFSYLPDISSSEVIQIEAEDGELFGNAEVTENENTSGGKIVTNIGENKDHGFSFTVDVEEAGDYKLSIDYINNEPAPIMYTDNHPDGYLHPYNKDLVERYAQIAVNDQTPQTVYFKNTLSWDTVKNHVIDIQLEAGENTITIYNDNSYQFNDVIQYAPHFDKFEIAKAGLPNQEDENPSPGKSKGKGKGKSKGHEKGKGFEVGKGFENGNGHE
ncbi:LamG-like jellyroll fold domain-containing protein [Gracilibacillus sp. D59]|uniref:LamG-like jellyroll fold domain-containing protein n=1 Tax=Gracilibacillus sp. D59 TaxID=3457434 RepID=UPI003FCDEE4C